MSRNIDPLTHISGWLLEIHVVHILRHRPRGVVMVAVRLRQLPAKPRLEEPEVPLGTREVEAAGEPVPLLPHAHVEVAVDGLHHGQDLRGVEMCVDVQGGMVTCGGQYIESQYVD